MTAGEVCTYSVRATCGAPGFKIRGDTNADAAKATILYTEADQSLLALSTAAEYGIQSASALRPDLKPPGKKAAMIIDFIQAGDSTKIDG
jgi:hypothetical protein